MTEHDHDLPVTMTTTTKTEIEAANDTDKARQAARSDPNPVTNRTAPTKYEPPRMALQPGKPKPPETDAERKARVEREALGPLNPQIAAQRQAELDAAKAHAAQVEARFIAARDAKAKADAEFANADAEHAAISAHVERLATPMPVYNWPVEFRGKVPQRNPDGTIVRGPNGAIVYTNEDEGLISCMVPKPFLLTLDDGRRVEFQQGVQDVPASMLEHWWVKANGVLPVEADPQQGGSWRKPWATAEGGTGATGSTEGATGATGATGPVT